MKFVQFNIFRKAAFAGALLPYDIYINGQFVGIIKNGKTLSVFEKNIEQFIRRVSKSYGTTYYRKTH